MRNTNTYICTFYRPQRSCEGYVFTGVCLSTGGVSAPKGLGLGVCSRGVSAPRGVGVGCLLPGVCAWSGRGCLLPGGVGIQACTEADPPRERRLLLRTVRILLECILLINSGINTRNSENVFIPSRPVVCVFGK